MPTRDNPDFVLKIRAAKDAPVGCFEYRISCPHMGEPATGVLTPCNVVPLLDAATGERHFVTVASPSGDQCQTDHSVLPPRKHIIREIGHASAHSGVVLDCPCWQREWMLRGYHHRAASNLDDVCRQ